VEDGDSFESFKEATDLIFLAFCLLEIIVKITVNGAFVNLKAGTQQPYLKSKWHQLDVSIALLMLFSAIIPWVHEGLSRLYVFRSIRILRPLLSVSRFSGLRTASMAVKNSFLVISVLLAITGLVLRSWTVASLYAFNGKLDHCVGGEKLMHLSKVDCSWAIFAQDGVMRPMVWAPPEWERFDNNWMALLIMFRALNSNGWTRIVQHVLATEPFGHLDSTVSGIVRSQSVENALPFISLQIFGNMMIVQCITARLINAIDVSRRRAFLTRAQKAMNATTRLVFEARTGFLKEPAPSGIKILQYYIRHDFFEWFAMSMILINICVLMSEHHDASEDHMFFKEVANFIFIVWYTVEQTLMVLTFGAYYSVPVQSGRRTVAWMNAFDLVITLLALLKVVGLIPSNGINVLCAVRVIRLLRHIPSLGTLLQAITKSTKIILGCFVMLFIITSSYAVVASAFFLGVKHGEYLNRQSNFDTPVNALQILCRIIGGEEWPSIMDELAVAPPLCTPGNGGDCGSLWAVPFMVSFYILVQYMFLPLLSLLLCAFFETVGQETVISAHDLRLFVRIWKTLDPNCTGFIAVWKICTLLERLDTEKSILGLGPHGEQRRIEGLIFLLQKSRSASIALDRPKCSDGLGFQDVCIGLMTAYGYPWCIPSGTAREQSSGLQKLGKKGGVLEEWARRRNATTIRDALLWPFDQHLPGLVGAIAGKLWKSYDGLLHVWVVRADALPAASTHGAYCNITLLCTEDTWKKKDLLHDLLEEEEKPLDDEASSGHGGPMHGWLRRSSKSNHAHLALQQSAMQPTATNLHTFKGIHRGTTYRTKTKRGCTNPVWDDHLVIPVVSSGCSLVFTVAEDSTGWGHKRLFGSAEAHMCSIVEQSMSECHLPLMQEGYTQEKQENATINTASPKNCPSAAQPHTTAQVTVCFLYKSMQEGRLQVAAAVLQCLDTVFSPENESAPSSSDVAAHPNPPETMKFYEERAFRDMKRDNHRVKSTAEPINQQFERMSANLSDMTRSRFSSITQRLPKEAVPEGLEMGLRINYTASPRGDISRRPAPAVLHLQLIAQQKDFGKTNVATTTISVKEAPEDTKISSQLWSYFGGMGKVDKGTRMSRRSSAAQHAHGADQIATGKVALSSDLEEVAVSSSSSMNEGSTLLVDEAQALSNSPMLSNPDTLQLVSDTRSREDTTPTLLTALSALAEADEDEDVTRPVARQAEIGQTPTLSGYVTTFLATPRGASLRSYVQGKDAAVGAEEAGESKVSVTNSFSTLRGIVDERRSMVED